MIPTSVFLAKYTPETVRKASSLIEVAGEIDNLPGGDGLARWAKALDWVCNNAGGVDRSKSAGSDDMVKRLRAFGKEAALKSYGDSITWQAADHIESLSAELSELRAQMLSDQGKHEAERDELEQWRLGILRPNDDLVKRVEPPRFCGTCVHKTRDASSFPCCACLDETGILPYWVAP